MSVIQRLDALGASDTFRSHRVDAVTGVDGSTVAELSLVPGLYVKRCIAKMRLAPPMPSSVRIDRIAAAGAQFLRKVGGVPLDEHERRVSQASGVALSVVREASRAIVRSAAAVGETVRRARPLGTGEDWHEVSSTGAVWARRGEVLAVQAPGNHPATHAAWLEALALGYRVAVRPSRREPFTPYRLVQALRKCGFGADQVTFLPTDHAVAREFVDTADLALVYGGSDVVARYRDRRDVLVQGPGRSKVLIAHGDWAEHVDTVVSSVAGFGGTACVNASVVLVDGDATGFAKELARRLAGFAVLPPASDAAVLPAFPLERAWAIESYLRSELTGGELLPGGALLEPLAGGGAVLRPAVVLLDRPDAPQLGIELPFPCVWVAPWSPADGIAPLRHSLTVTAITEDDALLASLMEETTIGNVHIGHRPTHEMRPGLPHDGHLAEFLMRSKTVIRGDLAHH
ncbi:aldehyde dehydrogenase [Amycolatopsis orientalis]|uniref:Aldehyde dehydrogenase n=1 Tax=Amycolatopsis orientalis TaxID=31958 RepID=A0A193BV73_AMYOR|nr:aldehyde dehydrogenase family protein [Amycolatopsis orientalis]ANN16126.1 aldehyde dehydrogenase [Amycolatopsis orientalis]